MRMALSGLKSSLWQDVKSLHAQKSKLPLHVLAAEMAVSSPPRPLPFFLLLTLPPPLLPLFLTWANSLVMNREVEAPRGGARATLQMTPGVPEPPLARMAALPL